MISIFLITTAILPSSRPLSRAQAPLLSHATIGRVPTSRAPGVCMVFGRGKPPGPPRPAPPRNKERLGGEPNGLFQRFGVPGRSGDRPNERGGRPFDRPFSPKGDASGGSGAGWSAAQLATLLLIASAPLLPGSEYLNYLAGLLLFFAGGSLALASRASSDASGALRTDGAFSLSRHPLYGGLLTSCVGLSILSASSERLVASLLLYALLSFKASADDRLLKETHGQAFERWAAQVPPLLPDISKPKRVIEGLQCAFAESGAGEYDRTAIEEEVLYQASSAPLVLFTRESSAPCKRALDLLRETGATPVVIQLDDQPGANLKRSALGRITGKSSFPSCWIGGEYVGGFDDGPSEEAPGLVKLSFQGRLRAELESAEAIPLSMQSDGALYNAQGDAFAPTSSQSYGDASQRAAPDYGGVRASPRDPRGGLSDGPGQRNFGRRSDNQQSYSPRSGPPNGPPSNNQRGPPNGPPSNNQRGFGQRPNNQQQGFGSGQQNFGGRSNTEQSLGARSNNEQNFGSGQQSFGGRSNSQQSFGGRSNSQQSFGGPPSDQQGYSSRSDQQAYGAPADANDGSVRAAKGAFRTISAPPKERQNLYGSPWNEQNYGSVPSRQQSYGSRPDQRESREYGFPSSKPNDGPVRPAQGAFRTVAPPSNGNQRVT